MKGTIKREFAGKERGFAFNMYTWEIACEMLDIAVSEVLQMLEGKAQFKTIRVIIYAALKSYAEMNGEDLDINDKQVGTHLNLTDTIITDIMTCMGDSMETGKKLEGGEPSKKKSTIKI